MPVLRSRDIPSPTPPQHKSTPPPTTTTVGQPPTPAKTAKPLSPSLTPPSRRRSLRLSPYVAGPTPNRCRNDAVLNGNGNASVNFAQFDGSFSGNDCVSDRVRVRVSDSENVKLLGQIDGIKEEVVEDGVLSLRSGTRVLKRISISGGEKDGSDSDSDSVGISDINLDKVVDNVIRLGHIDAIKEKVVEGEVLSLRSGTRVFKRVSISGGEEDGNYCDSARVSDFVLDKVVDDVKRLGQVDGIKEEVVEDEVLSLRSGTRVSKRASIGNEEEDESKKMRRLSIGDSVQENDGLRSVKVEEGLRSPKRYTREEKGKGVLSNGDVGSPRRYTREEKGKGVNYVLVDENENFGVDDDDNDYDYDVNLELGLYLSREGLNVDVELDQGVDLRDEIDRGVSDSKMDDQLSRVKYMKDKHKNIARLNAHKYAHFSMDDDDGLPRAQVDGEGVLDREDEENEVEVPEGETRVPNVEDWPGPFSTAMKIIRDREKNLGKQARNSCSGGMPLISWTPRKERGSDWKRPRVPSLQSMCLKILSENVDAIGSLNYVPDVLRHRLCQMLCDSRRMNAHFFSLLLQGSPSEIRVADCSWLEEEDFESSINGCDTSKLMVLQLDLSGHCISDASLLKAVVPKGLPVLTTISLKGACRISDAGLNVIVSAAPVLRSLNLSQCSLLTDVGIKTIADSLGSIVHELYLDDCDTLNAMNILPSLQRLAQLEVLSLRGISSVSDKFIKSLLTSNGQNIKELVLANCVNLTDSSLKVIAETCSHLCVLDLSYLRKLTDIGMAHLANGCHGIQDLRLCRNAFSDDAIAAFFETSGESLKELSLNNVIKVGQNATISLARRCKNLESLDISWCRSLTDDALGLIADSCTSLRLLKIFGCTQITKTFVDGHSNPHLHVVGMKLTPILENIKRPDFQQGPLYYSAVPSF